MNITEAIDKSLFFFGAGASYDAQCKLSSGMLDDIKKRIANSNDETFNKPEKETLKFLLSCLSYHSEWRTLETSENFKFTANIEELALLIRRIKNRENFLPYPITGNWADKLGLLESEFNSLPDGEKFADSLFSSLDKKIKSQLLKEWLEPKDYSFLEVLKRFFEDFPTEKFKMNIFSLNNDMVIENYFTANENKPWRGFFSGSWRGFEEEDIPEDFSRINLYKLHGSLDWVRLDSGDFKEEDQLTEEDKSHIEEQHYPYLIFGQGTKTFSVEPFFTLIQHLRQKLNERSYFFIIGYSFFDPYINNLLIDAVKGTSKKLIIINPAFGPDQLKSNGAGNLSFEFLDKFKRIKYPTDTTNKTLANYIEDIQKNSFYSELPEFNIKQINATSLEFLPIGTSEFLNIFFANKGENFIELIKDYETTKEEDKPF